MLEMLFEAYAVHGTCPKMRLYFLAEDPECVISLEAHTV